MVVSKLLSAEADSFENQETGQLPTEVVTALDQL